jgi:Family of unknown function (DUF7002)
VTEAELLNIYPRLWHMAEDGSWPSIQESGLLSTRSLLDLYEIEGDQRRAILSQRRPDSTTISKLGLPDAVIRDQKPMSEGALQKCLEGLSAEEWFELLNEKAFFWLSRERLRGLLGARAYRNKPQTVLTLRTESVLAAHRERILLSPINSGSTIYNPRPRGRETFGSIAAYDFDYWRKKKGSKAKAVVELAVSGGVPDIMDHVLTVHRVVNGESEELWKSPAAAADDGP